MTTFDETITQHGDRIVEETKQSYEEMVERGMVFKKEPTGENRRANGHEPRDKARGMS